MTFASRVSGTGSIAVIGGVIVHLLMLVSLHTGLLNPLFDDAVHRAGRGVDFYGVYQAGRNLVDGVSIYSLHPQQQVVPFYNPYRYHPFVASTVGILSLTVRPDIAYVLWIFLQEILLAVNIILTMRLIPDRNQSLIAVSLWLLFSPFYLELFMGQFSYLMASLMFWSIIAWLPGIFRTGDTFWILSLMVKSNSVLLAPVLLKLRRWPTIFLGAAVSLGTALPYFLFVRGSGEDFARNITQPLTAPTLFGNQGCAAFIGLIILRTSGLWTDYVQEFVPRVAHMNELLVVPLMLWTIVIVLAACYVTYKGRSEQSPEMFLLWILAYVLLYKHVWEHQYVMLLPVFVILYFRITSGHLPMSRWLFWTVFTVIAVPTAFVFVDRSPVLFDPEISWNHWESFLVHAPKPIASLVLFCSVGAHILRNNPERNPQPGLP